MKIFSFFFTLLLLPFSLQAFYCVTDIEANWTLEVRGAYYQPAGKKIQKFYSDHWLDYEVEASYRIHPYFDIWGGVYWARKHATFRPFKYGFKDSSKIYVLPIALGAKFVYPIFPYADLYVGAGICYSYFKIHNKCVEEYYYWGLHHSPFKRNILKSGVGGIFKVGLQVPLCKSTFVDVFVDYYAQSFGMPHHHDKTHRDIFRHDINVSGFKYGAGIGVYF